MTQDAALKSISDCAEVAYVQHIALSEYIWTHWLQNTSATPMLMYWSAAFSFWVRKNVSVAKLQRYLVWIQFTAPECKKNGLVQSLNDRRNLHPHIPASFHVITFFKRFNVLALIMLEHMIPNMLEHMMSNMLEHMMSNMHNAPAFAFPWCSSIWALSCFFASIL
jgi:hypothetical protein